MVEIQHTIKDELGLHARPAAHLVKKASEFQSAVQIGTPAKMVDAKRIMGVMGLSLKTGDTFTMTFDGPDEAEAAKGVEAFLAENL